MKQLVAFLIMLSLTAAFAFWALDLHFVRKPTAAQLFGCDWANTDIPNLHRSRWKRRPYV